ncbi:ABC transporter ATP-binding protein [Martelella soudanensis]|uniref:ABC transporter ATP-binding protein n=1 Tax=unclassified Martelella TaxID=2629616 RepID=UPI0015DF70B3|nr:MULTISPECIES: ABC transporter ATP-binding protein [unclassified Martelella]
MTAPAPHAPLLSVRDLTVQFPTERGMITTLDKISFNLGRGEVLGLIGESGSGKSVTMRALLRILPPRRTTMTGSITMEGKDVLSLKGNDLANYRGGSVAMIFQEPMLAFDPVFTIGRQIAETVVRHKGVSWDAAYARALDMLELVRIPSAKSRLDNYPHEMSGGMRQRAMIALALACSPKLLLADEPTTALDATVQIQVILLLRELQKELGMATIFVTHDVGVAAEISDQIAVMYAGRIIEAGTASEVLKSPAHPYTRGLLSSTIHGAMAGQRIEAIPGMPPDLANMPPGCAFSPRCPLASAACRAGIPPLGHIAGNRTVACIRVEGVPA